MRAGVWWSAAALTLLFVVTTALRTPQADGTSRISRRLASPEGRGVSSTSKTEEVLPTFRPRSSRRREEPATVKKEESPRDIGRTRSRNRPPDKDVTSAVSDQVPSQTPRNERFDSRRTSSRFRSRAVEKEANVDATTVRDNTVRSRTRANIRRAPVPLPTTPVPIEISSSLPSEEKAESINTNFEDIEKTVPKEDNTVNQFKRRSSTSRSIVEATTLKRNRGRGNRANSRTGDLEVSGTTNTLSALLGKEQTTVRSGDLRESRKLRYRTRPSDTDTNLTGEGLAKLNEVIGSSQKKESSASQSDVLPASSVTVDNIAQQSTEKMPLKTTKVIRRPLARGKVNLRPAVASQKKVSEEISEDDNYPASFKALIQAKNALRSKSNLEEGNEKVTAIPDNLIETTPSSEAPKSKSAEYRPRGTYTPRNRKASSFTSSSTSPSSIVTEKPYKFSRKFNKVTTTIAPKSENSLKNKRAETNNSLKKPLSRSSYFSRKTTTTSKLSTQAPTPIQNEKFENISTVAPKSRGILPRTAYYSRLRNKVSKTEITSTELPKVDVEEIVTAEKKAENTVDMPVILTMLNGASKNIKIQDDNQEKGKNVFLIDVTSTESLETINDNEVGDKIEDSENKSITNVISTTQKYHSHYNEKSDTAVEQKVKVATGATPSIRNIQTRKYGRKPINRKDSEDILVSSTPKIREKSFRKFSDTFSKTTEPSTNVITLESEKPKNRFSSKYRASYLDKPFYKPTVPTVTPSTVEGEEIQLGPDMNAISFTQSGGTLSSADLRLSESLAKPSQVMNVEASHHSPSVTVSIFDALAEILTSTPRPRLSTTTEVTQTQNTNSDVKQTLNGVSNNINVNSVGGFTSQDTLSTISINTNTKSVQTADKTTPNVFNSMSVGESVTQSLKIEEGKMTFVNTPVPASTLLPTTPTTPLSARRPFAIKVLYSDTESSTDKITTAFVPSPTQPSTDSSPTVYNSVSDLLLSNNNLLVSSDLTSMLSNNIKNIIQNMDEESKSRISVDMAKLLKSLIPRALDKLSTDLNNADSIPNTTPYSLEDINDTANIEINNRITNENLLQNVTNISVSNVNTPQSNVALEEPRVNTQAVNSLNLISTESLSDNQTTVADVPLTTESSTQQFLPTTANTVAGARDAAALSISDSDSLNLAILSNNDQSSVATSTVDTLSVATNQPAPVPFFTNFQLDDFNSEDVINSNLPSMNMSPEQLENIDNIQDPSQLSPLQIWILSKKARVLKMIEDLIRQHNNEIATGPLTDIGNEPNVQFSSRLTEIMNTMNLTTESSDLRSTTESSISTTTSFSFPISVFSTTPPNLSERIAFDSSQTTTLMADTIESTTLQIPSDVALSTAQTDIDNTPLQGTSETTEAFPSTTPVATMESATNGVTLRSQEEAETTTLNRDEDQISTPANINTESGNTETTTASVDTDSTTYTSDSAIKTTTQAGIETTTIPLINDRNLNDAITVNSQPNVATPAPIPKKDYVIFGILPNNTVTKQIRTERPNDGNGNAIFKFIPIDEVTVKSQDSNVLKLASTKMPKSNTEDEAQTRATESNMQTITENNDQTPQIQTRLQSFDDPTSTAATNAATPFESNTESYSTQPSIPILMSDPVTTTESTPITTESGVLSTTTRATIFAPTTIQVPSTTFPPTTTSAPTTTPIITTIPTTTPVVTTTIPTTTTTVTPITTTMQTTTLITSTTTPIIPRTSAIPTTTFLTSTVIPSTTNVINSMNSYQNEAELLQSLLQGIARNPKNLKAPKNSKIEEEMKLLQALLSGTGQNPNQVRDQNSVNRIQTTTFRSIEEDIRQYEEDTKLLKALLQATGRDPAELNLPSVDSIRAAAALTTDRPTTVTVTTTSRPTTTFTPITTTSTTRIITPSINDDTQRVQEDTKFLQSLLQAQGQNTQNANLPIISGITSNVRISSNPFATSLESNPTSPINIRPVYTTRPSPVFTTSTPRTVLTSTPFQSQPVSTATEDIGISTTFSPINSRFFTTPRDLTTTQNIGRTVVPRFTTEIPSTSTFSVEEDLAFLQNLKSVLNTNTNNEDSESALANRIIALAVERSLNEIQSGTGIVSSTTTAPITTTIRTTTTRPTTTRPTTTRPTTTLNTQSTPSIEDDLKQFEEDTKLLQALLKATGQDPSKFNIPSLPITNKPSTGPSVDRQTASTIASATTVKPFGAKIAVKDDLKNVQDDAKLLQTLKQLQDAQDITTQKNKIALTGQSSDEALQKLIQQSKPSGMVSEATKSSISLSTEYGNSNDALLAALLKEQGFGPTTASSLDEQLRLSIPLEPPRAVAAEQAPGRGQLVSAAINVTRAFSQFLGAAIQGAAQTVQNVIRAGQRAATDVYSGGSGASG